MMQPFLSRLVFDTRGGVLAEFAVMLTGMIVATFVVLDIGLFLWTDVTLNRATHAAARCGAVNPTLCGSDADIQNYAVSQSWGGGNFATANYSVATCTSGAFPNGVQVTGTYAYSFITPGIGTVTLTQTACFPPWVP